MIEEKEFQFVRPQFIDRMDRELLTNSTHKGDWNIWQPDKLLLVSEINWHLAKLVQALLEGNSAKVSEYSADMANYAMKADEIYGLSVVLNTEIEEEKIRRKKSLKFLLKFSF